MAAEPTLRYPCCDHCMNQRYACDGPDHSAPCGAAGCPGRIPFELETEG